MSARSRRRGRGGTAGGRRRGRGRGRSSSISLGAETSATGSRKRKPLDSNNDTNTDQPAVPSLNDLRRQVTVYKEKILSHLLRLQRGSNSQEDLKTTATNSDHATNTNLSESQSAPQHMTRNAGAALAQRKPALGPDGERRTTRVLPSKSLPMTLAKDSPVYALQQQRQEVIAALQKSASIVTLSQGAGADAGAGTSMELYRLGLPRRQKTHWDYLLDEMVWLANDFHQEKKWKVSAGKHMAAMIAHQHKIESQTQDKQRKEHEMGVRDKRLVAAKIARQVRQFWHTAELKAHGIMSNAVVRAQNRSGSKKSCGDQDGDGEHEQEEEVDESKTGQTQGIARRRRHKNKQSKTRDKDTWEGKAGDDNDGGGSRLRKNDAETKSGGRSSKDVNNTNKGQQSVAEPMSELGAADAERDGDLTKSSAEKEERGTVREKGEDDMKREVVAEMDMEADDESEGGGSGTKRKRSMRSKKRRRANRDTSSEDDSEASSSDDTDSENDELDANGAGRATRPMGDSDEEREIQSSVVDEGDWERTAGTLDRKVKGLVQAAVSASEALLSPLSSSYTSKRRFVFPTADGTESSLADSAGHDSGHGSGRVSAQGRGRAGAGNRKARLFAYQHAAVGWLEAMEERQLHAVLGDEAGAGKTVVTLALVSRLIHKHHLTGTHLVLVPEGRLMQWVFECSRWCPELCLQVYGGDVNERAELRARWVVQGRDAVQICLCSLKQAWEDREEFKKRRWRNLIIDSSYMLQEDLPMVFGVHDSEDEAKATGDSNSTGLNGTPSAQSADVWCSLLPFFPSERRILLSDGPLPCTLQSLFAWACFLMPHLFPTISGLRRWLRSRTPGSRSHKVKALLSERDMAGDITLVEQMQELVRPFFLRRCLRPLQRLWPQPVHSVIKCDLTQRQCDACASLVESEEAEEALESGDLQRLLVLLFRLRRILNYKGPHPHVCLKESEEAISTASSKDGSSPIGKSKNAPLADCDNSPVIPAISCCSIVGGECQWQDLASAGERNPLTDAAVLYGLKFDHGLPDQSAAARRAAGDPKTTPVQQRCRATLENCSGKLDHLGDTLLRLRREGRRIILCAQQREAVDMLEVFVSCCGLPAMCIRDHASCAQHQRALLHFRSTPHLAVVVVSTRSFALAESVICLCGATAVIFFEPEWDPIQDAIVHRSLRRMALSYNGSLSVHWLLAKDSVEDSMVRMANESDSGTSMSEGNLPSQKADSQVAATETAAATGTEAASSSGTAVSSVDQAAESSQQHGSSQPSTKPGEQLFGAENVGLEELMGGVNQRVLMCVALKGKQALWRQGSNDTDEHGELKCWDGVTELDVEAALRTLEQRDALIESTSGSSETKFGFSTGLPEQEQKELHGLLRCFASPPLCFTHTLPWCDSVHQLWQRQQRLQQEKRACAVAPNRDPAAKKLAEWKRDAKGGELGRKEGTTVDDYATRLVCRAMLTARTKGEEQLSQGLAMEYAAHGGVSDDDGTYDAEWGNYWGQSDSSEPSSASLLHYLFYDVGGDDRGGGVGNGGLHGGGTLSSEAVHPCEVFDDAMTQLQRQGIPRDLRIYGPPQPPPDPNALVYAPCSRQLSPDATGPSISSAGFWLHYLHVPETAKSRSRARKEGRNKRSRSSTADGSIVGGDGADTYGRKRFRFKSGSRQDKRQGEVDLMLLDDGPISWLGDDDQADLSKPSKKRGRAGSNGSSSRQAHARAVARQQDLCKWTHMEDEAVRRAVDVYGTENWALISSVVNDSISLEIPGRVRSSRQCADQYSRLCTMASKASAKPKDGWWNKHGRGAGAGSGGDSGARTLLLDCAPVRLGWEQCWMYACGELGSTLHVGGMGVNVGVGVGVGSEASGEMEMGMGTGTIFKHGSHRARANVHDRSWQSGAAVAAGSCGSAESTSSSSANMVAGIVDDQVVADLKKGRSPKETGSTEKNTETAKESSDNTELVALAQTSVATIPSTAAKVVGSHGTIAEDLAGSQQMDAQAFASAPQPQRQQDTLEPPPE